jgi:hypothetical protein
MKDAKGHGSEAHGAHDNLLSDKEYAPSIRYIKARYAP